QIKKPESITTQQMSSPNQQTLYNAQAKSNQTDNETLAIQKQQQLNTNRLKNIKGNSTYKNTYYDKKYEGILSIETDRSEEHTSELQSRFDLVCRLLLEKKKKKIITQYIT